MELKTRTAECLNNKKIKLQHSMIKTQIQQTISGCRKKNSSKISIQNSLSLYIVKAGKYMQETKS